MQFVNESALYILMGHHATFHLSDNGEGSPHGSLCLGMVCLGCYHTLPSEKYRKEIEWLVVLKLYKSVRETTGLLCGAESHFTPLLLRWATGLWRPPQQVTAQRLTGTAEHRAGNSLFQDAEAYEMLPTPQERQALPMAHPHFHATLLSLTQSLEK